MTFFGFFFLPDFITYCLRGNIPHSAWTDCLLYNFFLAGFATYDAHDHFDIPGS